MGNLITGFMLPYPKYQLPQPYTKQAKKWVIIWRKLIIFKLPLSQNPVAPCNFLNEGIKLMELLTHWGQVTHIYISKLTIIGSDNGFLPGLCQAIIWTNDNILPITSQGTYFNDILIQENAIVVSKMAAILSRTQCVKACIIITELTWGYWWLEIKMKQNKLFNNDIYIHNHGVTGEIWYHW